MCPISVNMNEMEILKTGMHKTVAKLRGAFKTKLYRNSCLLNGDAKCHPMDGMHLKHAFKRHSFVINLAVLKAS